MVYYRVPDPARERPIPAPDWSPRALAAKLDIRDTPFAPWLERELARRADFECVETMAEFRREARAITKTGQFKGSRGRHEKDDTHRIDDRSHYVLGWSNERKLEALLWQAESLAAQLAALTGEQAEYEKARDAAIHRGQVLAGLDQTREFADIDWQSVVNRTEELKAEKRQLEAASAELARLNRELEAVRVFIAERLPQHEEEEEAAVYPVVARLMGGEDPMSSMARAHVEISHLGRMYLQLLDDLPPEGPTPDDLMDLRRVLYGLHAILRLHFAQEEEAYAWLSSGEPVPVG